MSARRASRAGDASPGAPRSQALAAADRLSPRRRAAAGAIVAVIVVVVVVVLISSGGGGERRRHGRQHRYSRHEHDCLDHHLLELDKLGPAAGEAQQDDLAQLARP